MHVTIDRIENDVIVVELPTGETINADNKLFPEADEGDVFVIHKSGKLTTARRRRIEEKMERLGFRLRAE
ncbi:MAG: DUF3006 domain-containing protein [Clostridia bacterium]|nr:DUF3006 domain-containing protein [Clostridia bacterium]